MSLSAWVPLIGLFVLALLFALFSVSVAPLTGPRRYNRAKLEAYECGIEPTPQPIGGGRFPVKFFLVAMLFIVFDIETVFLYPWAVTYRSSGSMMLFNLGEMAVFVAILFVGYIYVWRKGAFEWD
jgi:NADH-quinone oxidoreductase subunit A